MAVRPFPGNEKRRRGRETSVLSRLGWLCQLIGLVMLPVAIAGNLSPVNPLSLGTELTLTGVGVVLFFLGMLLRRAGGRGN
jgi:hypothetical protein